MRGVSTQDHAAPPATPWAQVPTRDDPDAARTPAAQRWRAVAPPLAVFAVLIAWRTAADGWSTGTAALTAAAVVVVAAAATWPGPFRSVTHRFGAAVGHVVSTVAFGVLALFAVLLPYTLQRLFRIDPLEGPVRRDGTWWVARARRGLRPGEPWTADAAIQPVTPRTRRRRRVAFGAVVATLGLLVGTVGYVALNTRFTSFGILSPAVDAKSLAPPFPADTPAAYEGADWYPQHQRDIRWIWTVATAWNPFSMLRIKDVQTQTVNVVGGVRRTWRPPACDCKRVTVWFYGGSTAFGLGQRDEHTIASELARVAWADGVALDIDNRGVPGWLHWQDANRYAWDTATYGPPDATVFYDGFNEIFGTEGLDDVGDGYAPVDPYAAVYWRTLTDDARAPAPPDGAKMLETPTLDPDAADDEAGLIMRRYDRSRRMSRDTAEADDVPVDWFWQPSRWSRPKVDGEPDSGDFGDWHRLDRQLRDQLAPEVHDVAGALDGSDEPYFYDDAHHDEQAAHLIAVAMWKDLRARYLALTDQG